MHMMMYDANGKMQKKWIYRN